MIFAATEADFETRVIGRSKLTPVVVDFWADWCQPCHRLAPLLERAANAREGKVDLAKVDTEASPRLSAAYRIQSIPAVKAFKDGKVVDEFVGVIPPDAVERFFDGLVPSAADELAETDDEDALRQALASDPTHGAAAAKLGRILIARGDLEDAIALLDGLPGDFLAIGLAARARLTQAGDELADAFEAWDAGDHERALARIEEELRAAGDADRRDLLRQSMVGIFEELGPTDEIARTYRRRLSAALN